MAADNLVSSLLRLSSNETVCLLDSCGIGYLGSHLLIAGIDPAEVFEIAHDDPSETLKLLDAKLSGDMAAVFCISYDFGRKLIEFRSHKKTLTASSEPDIFLATFDAVILHDYNTGTTKLVGASDKFETIVEKLARCRANDQVPPLPIRGHAKVSSNFTRTQYLAAIETIKERIRDGDTYQTNLTQQLSVQLPENLTAEMIFQRLRRDHPSPFAAFIERLHSTVVSASPERFFRVAITGRNSSGGERKSTRSISTSPIKGTRRRGQNLHEDDALRRDLLTNSKERAENTMIVDLLRNDLGRVCEFGSVHVEKLCDLEEHPTLFHLVSTISGELRDEVKFSDILRAVFPCGSITGAPKISTMRIIDDVEKANRGLSMGSIGYYIPESWGIGVGMWDLSVAIRTMVIRGNVATFNVGGGITIDSDPVKEYEETLLKAKALLNALGSSENFGSGGV